MIVKIIVSILLLIWLWPFRRLLSANSLFTRANWVGEFSAFPPLNVRGAQNILNYFPDSTFSKTFQLYYAYLHIYTWYIQKTDFIIWKLSSNFRTCRNRAQLQGKNFKIRNNAALRQRAVTNTNTKRVNVSTSAIVFSCFFIIPSPTKTSFRDKRVLVWTQEVVKWSTKFWNVMWSMFYSNKIISILIRKSLPFDIKYNAVLSMK